MNIEACWLCVVTLSGSRLIAENNECRVSKRVALAVTCRHYSAVRCREISTQKKRLARLDKLARYVVPSTDRLAGHERMNIKTVVRDDSATRFYAYLCL